MIMDAGGVLRRRTGLAGKIRRHDVFVLRINIDDESTDALLKGLTEEEAIKKGREVFRSLYFGDCGYLHLSVQVFKAEKRVHSAFKGIIPTSAVLPQSVGQPLAYFV